MWPHALTDPKMSLPGLLQPNIAQQSSCRRLAECDTHLYPIRLLVLFCFEYSITFEWWMGDSLSVICPLSPSAFGLTCRTLMLMPATTTCPVFGITCNTPQLAQHWSLQRTHCLPYF